MSEVLRAGYGFVQVSRSAFSLDLTAALEPLCSGKMWSAQTVLAHKKAASAPLHAIYRQFFVEVILKAAKAGATLSDIYYSEIFKIWITVKFS